MAHVELSLSSAFVPQARMPAEAEFVDGVQRWAATVSGAAEPCVMIDVTATIAAISLSCSELLGLGNPVTAVGQPLVGGTLRLIDFTAGRGELSEPEIERTPPLLAISSQRLARGLMRVQSGGRTTDVTVDAISTPLWEADRVVASLTFFSAVC